MDVALLIVACLVSFDLGNRFSTKQEIKPTTPLKKEKVKLNKKEKIIEDKYDTIISNIEKYDGSPKGQEVIK